MRIRAQSAGRRRLRAALLPACLLWAVGPAAAQGSREQWQQPDRVMADLGLWAGQYVADVGCGKGYFTFRLARAVGDSGKVFAVDVDAEALEAVRLQAEAKAVAKVEIVQSEATDTRLESASADAVFLCDVLHEVPAENRAPLVQDIVRVLKPGGFLFLLDYRQSHDVPFDPYEKLIPREDLVKLCEDAGLSLDAEFHYLRYQVFLRWRKPS